MPLPSIADAAQQYLFTDRDKMIRSGVPEATINHIIRIRDVYSYWLQFPQKKDREIVGELMRRGNIQRSAAYEDLRLIKQLLGDLNKVSKDYARYRFLQMVERAYEVAENSGDARSMVAAADKLGKYMGLAEADEVDKGYDKIPVQIFAVTDNPEVIGLKRLPNARDRIKAMKQKYWNEEIVDVEAEEVDYDIDSIFHPKPINGNGT
ncbi:hypothetical protein [uncultured Duncaniella sp.]|nr:hypothetical protein [uncultured Duncaniella sp.]